MQSPERLTASDLKYIDGLRTLHRWHNLWRWPLLLATLVGVAVIIYFVVMVWDIIQGLDPADRAPEVLFKVACAVCVVSGVGLGMMLQQGLVALVKLAIGPPKAERLLCRLTLESESESRSLYRSKG